MEASTTLEAKYREGLDDGRHDRTAWDDSRAYMAGWVDGHEEVEARNIRAWLAAKRLAHS